jgi:hypothetical protein
MTKATVGTGRPLAETQRRRESPGNGHEKAQEGTKRDRFLCLVVPFCGWLLKLIGVDPGPLAAPLASRLCYLCLLLFKKRVEHEETEITEGAQGMATKRHKEAQEGGLLFVTFRAFLWPTLNDVLRVLRTTDYGLRTTDYGLRTTDYGLRTTDYELRTTNKYGRSAPPHQVVAELRCPAAWRSAVRGPFFGRRRSSKWVPPCGYRVRVLARASAHN